MSYPGALPASGSLLHPRLGAVRYRMDEVSDEPDTQVAQVIGMMRRYAVEDATSPQIERDAHTAVQKYGEPLESVYQYVRGRMGFVEDEETAQPLQAGSEWPIVETLVRPRDMSVLPAQVGDCDDYAMYGASLLTALGVPCAFVTVAADPAAPGIYSHVYLAAYPTTGAQAGQRVPLDLSHGPYPGWEVANRYGKRTEWPLTGGCGVLGWVLVAAGAYALYRVMGQAA